MTELQAPGTVTAVSTVPNPNNRPNFNTLAFNWMTSITQAMGDFTVEIAKVHNNATYAHEQAQAAATSAGDASDAADAATASAATAQNWATSLSVVSGGLYGARYYAQQAADTVAALPSGTINDATASATSTYSSTKIEAELGERDVVIADKQDTLISGTNIKTINSVSLLGAGDITVGALINRELRTSNTALTTADRGKLIDLQGSFNQTFAAAATLGSGWFAYLRNLGGLATLPDTYNGTFATDTLWTKGSGWTITGGQAVASSASTYLTSTSSPIVVGRKYRVTYTVSNYSSGTVTANAGGTSDTARNANGTYTFTTIAIHEYLEFRGSSAVLRIDNIIIDEIDATITLDPNASELIDGITSGPIRAGMTLLVVCNGTDFECVRVGPHTAIEVKTSGTTWQPPLGVRSARVTLIAGGVTGNGTYVYATAGTYTTTITVSPSSTYACSIGASAPYGSPQNPTTLTCNGFTHSTSMTTMTNGSNFVASSQGYASYMTQSNAGGLWAGTWLGQSSQSSSNQGGIIFEY